MTTVKLGLNARSGMDIYVIDAAHLDEEDAVDDEDRASIRASQLLATMVHGEDLRVPSDLTSQELHALADRLTQASNSADDDEERGAVSRGMASALASLSSKLHALARDHTTVRTNGWEDSEPEYLALEAPLQGDMTLYRNKQGWWRVRTAPRDMEEHMWERWKRVDDEVNDFLQAAQRRLKKVSIWHVLDEIRRNWDIREQ